MHIIDEMAIDVDPPNASAILKLLGLAQTYALTVYDAAFLELAMRLGLPLATTDRALRLAATNLDVPTFSARRSS